jgi:outer membrane protein
MKSHSRFALACLTLVMALLIIMSGAPDITAETLSSPPSIEKFAIPVPARAYRDGELLVKFAKGAYWPSLSVEGVYIREENEPASTFGLDERIYGVLRLDFPFFEGGLRRAEVGAARARLRQTEYGLSELRRQINVEVENSYLIFITQDAIMNRLRAEVEYAVDNFNAVTKQFRHGLADSIDVIDANTLLATSQRELANSEYFYQLAFIRLQRSIGTLLTSVISGQ